MQCHYFVHDNTFTHTHTSKEMSNRLYHVFNCSKRTNGAHDTSAQNKNRGVAPTFRHYAQRFYKFRCVDAEMRVRQSLAGVGGYASDTLYCFDRSILSGYVPMRDYAVDLLN